MSTRLWVRVVRRHKIVRQETQPCLPGEEREALTEICRRLDIPAPMWLEKNEREYESFRLTSFAADHFVESIAFDRLEIEFIDDAEKRGRPARSFD